MKVFKVAILFMGGVITSLSTHSQTTKFKGGSLYMPVGNVLLTGGNDVRFGTDGTGNNAKWSIEYHNEGMNFWKPNETNGDYKLFIKDNGTVGIGTSTPRSTFDVRGTIRAQNGFVLEGHDWNGYWNAVYLDLSAPYSAANLYPHSDAQLVIGKSNRRVQVYARQVWSEWYTNTSDERIKENIHAIESPLEKITKLKGVQYDIKKSHVGDTAAQVRRGKRDVRKDNIGFLAQDMQKIFPELVMEQDSTGLLGINYIGLIPVLVEALKEQQQKVIELDAAKEENKALQARLAAIEKQLATCCDAPSNGKSKLKSSQDPSATETASPALAQPALFQNQPNPFGKETSIALYLPESVQTALLNIYDLNGRQIQSFRVAERGSASVSISGKDFLPGMYRYALLADGELVDTKTMVVTE